ncbi:MAG: 50S ribosomal protein L5, partial [Chryseobacterium sp. SCN 40-13]
MEFIARPKKIYKEKIVPAMMEEFGYKSVMQVPRLEKIVVSQGLGAATADKKIVDALMAANAGIAIEAKGIKIRPSQMTAFEFDATDCPDLFPPLVGLAAYCNGTTKIKGVKRLAHKESNRGLTLQEEFGKIGLKIDLEDDMMLVHGGKGL